MNRFLVRVVLVLLFASFSCVLFWQYFTQSDSAVSTPPSIERKPENNKNAVVNQPVKVKRTSQNKREFDLIGKLIGKYSTKWKMQKKNLQTYRSLLGSCCNAISDAIVTQKNSPIGKNITYDADKKKNLKVTPQFHNLFPKESPVKNAPWDSCSVIGNGGILANSSCGKQIDSATYVLRCNLPPLNNGHEKDAGSKTNLVTANPSILFQKYSGLNERRRSFVDDIQVYGDALLLLPAFSYRQNTAVSLRVYYAVEDFGNRQQAVFYNPQYLTHLQEFWRGQGIRSGRLSTGIMMASLAMELCKKVHLYGFWPFGIHPYTYERLTNHYYDNRPCNRVHAMPAEFETLLNLHNKGVIHLHLGKCTN